MRAKMGAERVYQLQAGRCVRTHGRSDWAEVGPRSRASCEAVPDGGQWVWRVLRQSPARLSIGARGCTQVRAGSKRRMLDGANAKRLRQFCCRRFDYW